jgi:hypothetical protein
LDASTTSIMGSEPNIYNIKLTQVNSTDIQNELTAHNSDEILQPDEEETKKVIFTLGDDTTLIDLETSISKSLETKLVRISSNNEDCTGVNENVKRICSEIESFCSTSECIDASYHPDMEEVAKSVKAEVKTIRCDSCENENPCEILCANSVTDVIVIPSAEAILDFSQDVSREEDAS